jgi:hypothetical protein
MILTLKKPQFIASKTLESKEGFRFVVLEMYFYYKSGTVEVRANDDHGNPGIFDLRNFDVVSNNILSY